MIVTIIGWAINWEILTSFLIATSIETPFKLELSIKFWIFLIIFCLLLAIILPVELLSIIKILLLRILKTDWTSSLSFFSFSLLETLIIIGIVIAPAKILVPTIPMIYNFFF